jgi:hypothetical protein
MPGGGEPEKQHDDDLDRRRTRGSLTTIDYARSPWRLAAVAALDDLSKCGR